MGERNDVGWFDYTFGMNDDNGRLIQITIPAQNESDARHTLNLMLFEQCNWGHPRWNYWLNDCKPY